MLYTPSATAATSLCSENMTMWQEGLSHTAGSVPSPAPTLAA